MKFIELTGKHASGPNRQALVDDDVFDRLNQHKWKAKPNGGNNNVYAVRNSRTRGGRCLMVRMHREVLGLGPGDAEVDHIDHFGLNNQRANLRLATRSENILNSRARVLAYECAGCGIAFASTVRMMSRRRKYCSKACRAKGHYVARNNIKLVRCVVCGKDVFANRRDKLFCSDKCRCAARRGPTGPSLADRLLDAIVRPATANMAAAIASTHESDARRLLALLVKQGKAAIVGRKPSPRGRPSLIYRAA